MEVFVPGQKQIKANYDGVRARPAQVNIDTGVLTGAIEGLYQATGKFAKEQPRDLSYWKDIIRSGEQIIGAKTERENVELQIALENQRITDNLTSLQISNQLATASEELKLKQAEKNNDPDSWDAITGDFVSNVSVDTSKMSPEARAVAEEHVNRWKDQQIIGTKYRAVVQNQTNFKETADTTLQNAIRDIDPSKAGETIASMVHTKTITPEQAEAMTMEAGYKMQDRRFELTQNEMVQLINNDDPEGAARVLAAVPERQLDVSKFLYLTRMKNQALMEKNAKTEVLRDPQKAVEELGKLQKGEESEFSKYKFSEVQTQKFMDAAFQRSYENSNQSLSLASDDVANGTLKDPAQLDTDPRYKNLLPSKKQMVKDALSKNAPKNDSREFMAYTWAALNTPVVTDQTDPAYPVVQMHIAGLKNSVAMRFEGAYKDQLTRIIDDHFNGNNAEETELIRSLSDGFKDGLLGEYKVPYVEHGNRWEIDWGSLKSFGTEPLVSSVPVQGTALSPKDQMRAALGDKVPGKLKPGAPVVDQQKYNEASKRLYDSIQAIKQMGKQNKSPEEKRKYRDSVLFTVPLSTALKGTGTTGNTPDQRLQEANEVFNSLFPNGTN